MNDKFIIFQNGDIKGYVENEVIAKNSISELSDFLIDEFNLSKSQNTRVFRENIEMGIKIYTQVQGQYFNGPVILQHTLVYKSIPHYTTPKSF